MIFHLFDCIFDHYYRSFLSHTSACFTVARVTVCLQLRRIPAHINKWAGIELVHVCSANPLSLTIIHQRIKHTIDINTDYATEIIHPVKFFNDYITDNIRPDGRKLHEERDIKLNIGSLNTADSSALVKCGNTTAVCGIKMELAKPKAEKPNLGYIVMNVTLPALCSSKFRPGPPSDQAQVVSNIVSDIILNSKCVNLEDLCIVNDKLAWVLYCDVVCLDYDGSVVDASIISLLASLKKLSLPHVTYDEETEEISIDHSNSTPLPIHGLPVTTSFVVYRENERDIILTDPTCFEEDICGGLGANLIVCCNKGVLNGSYKFGGSSLSMENQEIALKIAKKRAKTVEKIIETTLESNKS